MTPERAAELVARWVRFYTRGLPTPTAQRRVAEMDADLHDHIGHQRAHGISERRIALSIASRMVRGLAADASWRSQQRKAITAHSTLEEAMRTGRTAYRQAVGVAVGAALTLVLLVGAVGIIGADGDAADLMYGGVLAIGAIGAVTARFQPIGMARVLFAMALAQASVAVIALAAGMVPAYNPASEIVALSGFFVVLFIGSAWLFRRAGRHLPPTSA